MRTDDETAARWWMRSSATALVCLIAVVLVADIAPGPTAAQTSPARSWRFDSAWTDPVVRLNRTPDAVHLSGWPLVTNLANLQTDCQVSPPRMGKGGGLTKGVRNQEFADAYTTYYVCGPDARTKGVYHLVRVPSRFNHEFAKGMSESEGQVGACLGFLQMLWGDPVVIARTADIARAKPDHFLLVAKPMERCDPPGSLKIEKLITAILQTDPATHVVSHPVDSHLRGWPLGSGDKALGTKCGPYAREARYGAHPPTEVPARPLATHISNYFVCAPRQPFKGTYQSVIVPVGVRWLFTLVLDSPDRPARHESCLADLVVQSGGPPEVIARSNDGHFWLMRIPLGVCGERSYLAQTFIYQLLHAGSVN